MARVKKAAKPAVKKPTVKSTAAKNVPVITSKIVESQALEVAPEKMAHFSNEGRKEEGEIVIQGDVHGFQDKAAKLAFMEEFVTINISEGTGKDAEKHIFVSVNGVGPGPAGIPWVPRGVDVKIKRKYLNVLNNARPVLYHNYEEVAPDGERVSKQRGVSADRYPFQVVEDTARGRAWLKDQRATRRAG